MVKPTKCYLGTGQTNKMPENLLEALNTNTHHVYDFAYAVEDDTHCHVAVRFTTEWPLALVKKIFPMGWNLQAVPEHRWDATVQYVRKNGNYYWHREKIPAQYADPEPNWYGWQQRVIDYPQDGRSIICVVDENGGAGKSYLANWMAARNKAAHIPIADSYKDVMRAVMARPAKWYIVDMPRAMSAKQSKQMYGAIETIKDGHAWDDRYKFEERWFDSPKITIFTNTEPPYGYLTKDRWITITL